VCVCVCVCMYVYMYIYIYTHSVTLLHAIYPAVGKLKIGKNQDNWFCDLSIKSLQLVQQVAACWFYSMNKDGCNHFSAYVEWKTVEKFVRGINIQRSKGLYRKWTCSSFSPQQDGNNEFATICWKYIHVRCWVFSWQKFSNMNMCKLLN
jgi:hypothetical protein